MHKNTLRFLFAILCIYFSLVLCEENPTTNVQEMINMQDKSDLSDSMALEEEARTKRRHRHHLYSLWGFYGLAIAYLIKIKVIVVAFFVGSAVYLGLRYMWPHTCSPEVYKESSVILDHPPPFVHHDHIPYSFDHYQDHHVDSSSWGSSGPTSFEPYSAYFSDTSSFTSESNNNPSDNIPADAPTFRKKRSSLKKETKDLKNTNPKSNKTENLSRQIVISEERIGDIMFNFLGLDTAACRRRFICEMEFKSQRNPLTFMAFRVIGRSFFAKYTNDQNPYSKALSFYECAVVNSQCVFIENSNIENSNDENNQAVTKVNEPNTMKIEQITENNLMESNEIIENANKQNSKNERNSYRKHFRGDRHLKL